DFRVCRKSCGKQTTLLQQMLLCALHSQRLQLALVLVLQGQERLTGLVIVQRKAAEQQGQQQAANAKEPAWIGRTGSAGYGHGAVGKVWKNCASRVMAKCYLGRNSRMCTQLRQLHGLACIRYLPRNCGLELCIT